MNAVLKSLTLTAALVALTACETADFERMNPLKPRTTAEGPAAPIRDGDVAERPVAAPSDATNASVGYEMPVGGENTFSLSVTGCLDSCPVVNVLLDPDNYWQRTAPEGVISGQGRDKLYDDVTNLFQAQGFYALKGQINILPGYDALCSDYAEPGQVFYISMSRNSGRRQLNFDTGCAGSAAADGAADAINGLIGLPEYMDIVSGVTPGDAE